MPRSNLVPWAFVLAEEKFMNFLETMATLGLKVV